MPGKPSEANLARPAVRRPPVPVGGQTPGHLKETPSQTAGPFVHIGLTPVVLGLTGMGGRDPGTSPIADGVRGERVLLFGRVFDGAGSPLRDAVLEFWQADAAGRYNSPVDPRGGADPGCSGWARVAADIDDGCWRLATIRPGRVPMPDGRLQAPHLSVWLVARGINVGLNTRLYFADAAAVNAEDPVLARIDPPARRDSLLAVPEDGGFRFDIHLQGPRETVFFDV